MISFRALFLLFFIFQYSVGFAQKKTDKLYNNYSYADVIKRYEKELEKDPSNYDLMHKLAVSYARMDESEKALEHYIDIIVLGESKILTPYDWHRIGHLYMREGKTRNASFAFKHLNEYEDFSLKRFVSLEKPFFNAQNIKEINTKYSEFSPVLNDSVIVFTSDRKVSLVDNNNSHWTGKPYLSIFQITTDTSVSLKVSEFSKHLNVDFHNGIGSFAGPDSLFFYTKITPTIEGVNRAKIIVAEKRKNKWKDKNEFKFNDKSYSTAHPVYFEKSKMLVFASDMPGGFGDMDLYYSIWDGVSWGDPVNFGPMINTPFKEVFPAKKSQDSNIMYFSSDGHFGYGGLDIYKCTLENSKVVSVDILPKQINSTGDDFGVYFISDSVGYVSSNRRGGIGGDDIYSFHVDLIDVKGVLLAEDANTPLIKNKLYLKNDKGIVVDSVITDSTGGFKFLDLPFENIYLSTGKSNEEELELFVNNSFLDNNADYMPGKKVSLDIEDYDDGELVIANNELLLPEEKNQANIYMESSSNEITDSVRLEFDLNVTLVLKKKVDSLGKYRCVVYEDGSKAVKISFVLLDSLGAIYDSLETDENGCIRIRKLIGEKATLALVDDQDGYLALKNSDQNGEIKVGKGDLIIIAKRIDIKGTLIDEKQNVPIANYKIYLHDDFGVLVDSSITNLKGEFIFEKLPYKKMSLSSLDDEDGELKFKMNNSVTKEESTGLLYLMSPEKEIMDSVYLDGLDLVTLYLDDPKNIQVHKCVIYEDGGKAVQIMFVVRDSLGFVIDSMKTDKEGCFKIRKLYPEGAVLELEDNDDVALRFNDTPIDLTKNEEITVRRIVKKCVIYEDGRKAVKIIFNVKDSLGFVVDTLFADDDGCFRIRKLYPEKSTLDLVDDSDAELVFGLLADKSNISVLEDGVIMIREKGEERLVMLKRFDLIGKIFDEESNLPVVDHKIYLFDGENKLQDSVKTNELGVFKFSKLPYSDMAIAPEYTDEGEFKINIEGSVDKENSLGTLFLMSGKREVMDSVYLSEDQLLTFYIEAKNAGEKNKCITYKDGKKVVRIVYVTRDSSGLIINDEAELDCSQIVPIPILKEDLVLIEDEDVSLFAKPILVTENVDTSFIENIYFEFNKATITNRGVKQLSRVIELLEKNSRAKIDIEGHTDSRGDDAYNLLLSNLRAKTVASYLIKMGISKNRITNKGYGEKELVNDCNGQINCSEEDHLKNRRTEFNITWE